MQIILILIPILIGWLALAGASHEGQIQVQLPANLLPMLAFGAVGFVFLRVVTWFFRPFVGDLNEVLDIGRTQREVRRRQKPMPASDPVEMSRDGSIIAYRYFDKMPDGTLTSVGKGVVTDRNPITGKHGWDYSGGWNISDRVPTLNNTNGIYAAKTPHSYILAPWRYLGYTFAKVELSGRVIEGEKGYRAQYCRILEILEEN